MRGVVHQLSVSRGGVPKRACEATDISSAGVAGDSQTDTRHHGGPERAVCLFAFEVIERLRAEGHPIVPGAVGENITIRGLDWGAVGPGGRFLFDGGVELVVTSFTRPCATIRGAFRGLEFRRIDQDLHPGQSRVYARVARAGPVRKNEGVSYRSPGAEPPG